MTLLSINHTTVNIVDKPLPVVPFSLDAVISVLEPLVDSGRCYDAEFGDTDGDHLIQVRKTNLAKHGFDNVMWGGQRAVFVHSESGWVVKMPLGEEMCEACQYELDKMEEVEPQELMHFPETYAIPGSSLMLQKFYPELPEHYEELWARDEAAIMALASKYLLCDVRVSNMAWDNDTFIFLDFAPDWL